MQVTEYIQFQPLSDWPPMYIHDSDECQSDQVLCIHKNDKHYHVAVRPFTTDGQGFVNHDCELVPTLRLSFLDEITSLVNDESWFTLAFNVVGSADWETGHIDEWDYELLGTLEQDGNNLVVKPLEVTHDQA